MFDTSGFSLLLLLLHILQLTSKNRVAVSGIHFRFFMKNENVVKYEYAKIEGKRVLQQNFKYCKREAYT